MPEPIDPRAHDGDHAFDAYLEALEAALDLPASERADIRDEVEAHLRDARAEAISDGAADETAATDAIRRFGDPVTLASELTRARRRGSTLLAAAGAGTWAAAGAAVRGFILGIALIATMLGAAGVLTAIAYRAGIIGTWSIPDWGWYTVVWAPALWFAAWQGARALVTVLANRTHRRAERVRPIAAIVGGLAVAWLSLAWLQAPQNLGSVVVLGLVPLVFVVAAITGSDREIERSRAARRASLALFATVVVAVPLLVILAGTPVETGLTSVGSVRPYPSMEALLAAQGFRHARPLRARSTGVRHRRLAERSRRGPGDSSANAAVVTARWRDLRVEAWRSDLSNGTLIRDHPSAVRDGTAEPGRRWFPRRFGPRRPDARRVRLVAGGHRDRARRDPRPGRQPRRHEHDVHGQRAGLAYCALRPRGRSPRRRGSGAMLP